MNIPFNKPFIIGRELDCITEAVAGEHLSGNGPFTRRCQDWLCNHQKVEKALLTHSGTAALEMAALLLDVKPGDEIIMPSYTFVSTANAFVLRGATPVFVDVLPSTLNIDPSHVVKALTNRTRAIVAVHYAGVMCDMDALLDISAAHGVALIEDAAQALMSTWKGKPAGSFGCLSALSFHETKNCISGEGGALLINAPAFVDRAQILWEKGTNRTQFFEGRVDKYTWVDVGSSFLPSELTAAFLWAQLTEADRITKHRLDLWERYRLRLQPLSEKEYFRMPCVPAECSGNGHIFHILLNSSETRPKIIRFLKERGIETVFHYVPLHSSPAGRKYGRVCGTLSCTEDIASRVIRLPMHYSMTLDEVDAVVDCLAGFWN